MTYRAVPLEEVLAALPENRRRTVEKRGNELIAKYKRRMTLAEIRKGQNISQAAVAEALGIGQMQISRLERRKDPRLSTIQRAIAAMGGELSLVATFPNQKTIVLHPSPTGDPKKSPKPAQQSRPGKSRGPA